MTEIIFGYPGVGTLIQNAILQSDYNMILGCITISIVAISTATLVVDLIYPFIDPRIRYVDKEGSCNEKICKNFGKQPTSA